MSAVKVCTVATNSQRYFPVLQESCRRFQTELVVLGWGEKWKGYAWKFQKMLEYLRTLAAGDIVMFIDAYDVVLLQDPKVLQTRFQQTGRKIVMSKDGDHPNYLLSYFIHYVFHPVRPGEYINTGAYIGYAGALRDLLEAIEKFNKDGFSENENDQEVLSRYCKQYPDAVDVDRQNEMFVTLYGGTKYWVGNRFQLKNHPRVKLLNKQELWVQATSTTSGDWHRPCVLHGPCNTDLTEILIALGYDIPSPPRAPPSASSATVSTTTAVVKATPSASIAAQHVNEGLNGEVGGATSHFKYLTSQFSSYWQYVWPMLSLVMLLVIIVLAITVAYLNNRYLGCLSNRS